MQNFSNDLNNAKKLLSNADAIVIGAGAGLSTSAGLEYTGERLNTNFEDFVGKYNFKSMYEAAFHSFETPEEKWAYFSRHIMLNRYTITQSDVYNNLLKIAENKNYFVITTNVDHLFITCGFDKNRVFYTQGDYGLWQCSVPCHNETYKNEAQVQKMVQEQKNMKIPSELIPLCPKCGAPMANNLRADDSFAEPNGWHSAAKRYEDFLIKHSASKIVFLELGVGYNTPGIIKYPFWQMTYQFKNANLISVNLQDSFAPKEIKQNTILLNGDIGQIILNML